MLTLVDLRVKKRISFNSIDELVILITIHKFQEEMQSVQISVLTVDAGLERKDGYKTFHKKN